MKMDSIFGISMVDNHKMELAREIGRKNHTYEPA
jgi:hypothetical protein